MPPGRSRKQPLPKPDQAELIAYYEARLGDFEAERDDLLQRLDACSTQQATLLDLDREHAQRSDEVVELQKALSNAHTFLFEERELLLELQAENEALHQHLRTGSSKAAQPVTTLHSHVSRPKVPGRFAQSARREGRAAPSLDKANLLSVSSEALWEQLQSLTDQLNDQKRFAAERVASLAEDRRIRETEIEAYQAAAAERSAKLCLRIEHLQTALQETTKDYILARRQKHEAAQQAAQLRDELTQLQSQSAKDVKEARHTAAQKLAEAQSEHKKCMDDYASSFCKQLQEREAEAADLATELEQTRLQAEQQVADLQAALARAKDNIRQLEQRRALDREGWANDVTLLRKQAAAVDRRLHQMRLMERLEDDERRDAILENLTLRAPDPNNTFDSEAAPHGPQPGQKRTFRRPGTPSHELGVIDDGIARLTTMLRQKESSSPALRLLGVSVKSPRSRPVQSSKGRADAPNEDGDAFLQAEAMLKA